MNLVRRHSAEIEHLLGQSTLTGPSSARLDWRGVAVERRVIQAAEKPELPIEHYFLLLWDQHFEGETRRKTGGFTLCRKRPGAITACLPGIRPATRSEKPHRVVACSIAPWFLHEVEAELDRRPTAPLQKMHGTEDVALRNLMLLLVQEAEAGGASGKVYAESLSIALATRLSFVGRSLQQPCDEKLSALPRPILRRVIDRMEAGLDSDLTLAMLATESGYSRAHFARMFRAATGWTPHRYLLDMRLRKAQSMLADPALPLTEVAMACGFSSHSHLSTAFRSRFGMAPSAFRRDR